MRKSNKSGSVKAPCQLVGHFLFYYKDDGWICPGMIGTDGDLRGSWITPGARLVVLVEWLRGQIKTHTKEGEWVNGEEGGWRDVRDRAANMAAAFDCQWRHNERKFLAE
jgi:hypothetical protein